MCAQKVHRVIMAIAIFVSLGLIHSGYFFEGSILLTIVGIAMLVWGLFDFCTILKILKKFLPDCGAKKVA